jgi:copine 4/6/7
VTLPCTHNRHNPRPAQPALSFIAADTRDRASFLPAMAMRRKPPSSVSAFAARPTLSLQFEARSLPKLPSGANPNPFLVVEVRDASDPKLFTRVAHTETVRRIADPKWSRVVQLRYDFGAAQVLRLSVYDAMVTNDFDDLSKHMFVGAATVSVSRLLLAEKQRVTLAIPGTLTGRLVVRAEESKPDTGDVLNLQFAIQNVRNARKPFFVLNRQTSDGKYSPIKYSEVLKMYRSGQTPNWNVFKPFSITLADICNGDKLRPLQIALYEYVSPGKHKYLCSYAFTVAALEHDFSKLGPSSAPGAAASSSSSAPVSPASSSISLASRTSFATIHKQAQVKQQAAPTKRTCPVYPLTKRTGRNSSTPAGKLALIQCKTSNETTFLDYLTQGGVTINTFFAIDISATNGNPSDPSSLQYNNPKGKNEYEVAISDVGSVLAAYDSTDTFTAWGFGACLPPSFGGISHCFPLSVGNPSAMCSHISGVVEAYRYALSTVAPHQPCRYSDVLRKVIAQVRDEDVRSGHSTYNIIVLVTDGSFSDYAEVADVICAAADLPLSVVIVGIGPAEMPLLERLDADDVRLADSAGIPCARDLVQFVPFRDHRSNSATLATAVLAEIPEQLCSYYRSMGIRPGDKRTPVDPVTIPLSPNVSPDEFLQQSFNLLTSSQQSRHSLPLQSHYGHTIPTATPAFAGLPGNSASTALPPQLNHRSSLGSDDSYGVDDLMLNFSLNGPDDTNASVLQAKSSSTSSHTAPGATKEAEENFASASFSSGHSSVYSPPRSGSTTPVGGPTVATMVPPIYPHFNQYSHVTAPPSQASASFRQQQHDLLRLQHQHAPSWMPNTDGWIGQYMEPNAGPNLYAGPPITTDPSKSSPSSQVTPHGYYQHQHISHNPYESQPTQLFHPPPLPSHPQQQQLYDQFGRPVYGVLHPPNQVALPGSDIYNSYPPQIQPQQPPVLYAPPHQQLPPHQ